jgi:hypothetical protein
MLRGVKGNCTKLERWNGTLWEPIGGKISITGPALTRETVEEEIVLDCEAGGGSATKKKSPGTKEIGDIAVEVLVDWTTPSGVKQVETATGAGTVTVAGNASVTITAAGLSGSPVTYAIPVPTGLPAVWMDAVRTYLQTNGAAAALRAMFDVEGTSASLVLTSVDPLANDGTLNIALAPGTATGITTAGTSANTVAGVSGTENTKNHHLFFEDFDQETATFWRILHQDAEETGTLVHATVKEVGEPTYEPNTNVKLTVTLEPTGEYFRRANALFEVALPAGITAPADFYGHH